MADECMEKAMLAMGWNMDTEIPMANEENKALLQELQKLTIERTELQDRYKEAVSRVEKIKEHGKNAEITINHKLQLLLAHQAEVRSESHLFQVAHREYEKLKEDTKTMQKDSENIKKLTEKMEHELCKLKQSIDKKTNRVQWAKNALNEWHGAMEDGNRGYQLIESYFKDDQLKARQKNQTRTVLLGEIEKARKELEVLYDEQKCLEQNLGSIAKLYRSAHSERRQMIETWKTAVTQMTQRENEITEGEFELHLLQKKSDIKMAEQRRCEERLNNVVENNRMVEQAIDELNVNCSDIKEQMQTLKDMIVLKDNEMDLFQKELVNLANRVEQQRAENKQLAKEKTAKLAQLEEFAEVLSKLQHRNISMQDKNFSAQQRLAMLEEMNDVEEKARNNLLKETVHVNGLKFRSEQQLMKLKDEQKVLAMVNEGIAVTICGLEKKMVTTDKELRRQTEVHYELAFKYLETERNIIKCEGVMIDPEVEHRNMQYLTELEDQHNKVLRRLQATEAQNTKLDFNMRKMTNSYNEDNKQLEVMQFKIKEALVYCEGGVKRFKSVKHTSHVAIVELSVFRMRVDEFESEITKCEDSTYNLQKHRMHLNRTIKDRIVEIKSQLDLLNLKRKHLEEEKGTLRADVGERAKHIEAVRARFELSSKLMGTNEDGSLITATQLKVETAQEKQMLLEEGNQLNAKVLKAEQEIKAMENTLLLLNHSNDGYRKRLGIKELEEGLENELRTAEIDHCRALERIKKARQLVFSLEQEKHKAIILREQFEAKLHTEKYNEAEHKETLNKLDAELREQKLKLERANRGLKMAIREAKQRGITDEDMGLFERELDLRQVEYHNMSALNKLADMAENDDEVGPKIIKSMAERGIKLPRQMQKSQSLVSWRSVMSVTSFSSSSQLTDAQPPAPRHTGSHARSHGTSASVSVVSLGFPG